MDAGQSPSTPVARTRRGSRVAGAKNAKSDQTWSRLYAFSQKMLFDYKDVLGLYVKWADFGGYLAALHGYKSWRAWTPVDVLGEIAAQRDILEKLGATPELFQAVERLENDLRREPRTLAEKHKFVNSITRFGDAVVLEHPKRSFPTEDVANREKIRNDFPDAVNKTETQIRGVKALCDEFGKAIKREREERRRTPANVRRIRLPTAAPDATPMVLRSSRLSARDVRAMNRDATRVREERDRARSLEDSARPKISTRRSTRNAPARGGSRAGHSFDDDAEVQAFDLQGEEAERDPLEAFHLDAGDLWMESRFRTPSPVVHGGSDGSSICLTPVRRKGLARGPSPDTETPDDAEWLDMLDAPAQVNGGGTSVSHGSGGRSGDAHLRAERTTWRGVERERSRTP